MLSLVPKKIKWNGTGSSMEVDGGRFITNVTTTPHVEVEKINYFFDGPVELHIVAVLWVMLEGHHLDRSLSDACRGSRLYPSIGDPKDVSSKLFKKYHEQYSMWRDAGIKKAKSVLVDDQKSVAILGLDIQEFFYRVRIDWREVATSVYEATEETGEVNSDLVRQSDLLRCLATICRAYREKIDPLFSLTHLNIAEEDTGLPIGLPSSLILANWYLKGVDEAIAERIRPAYYGRYVDDILLVLHAPKDPAKATEDAVATFMNDVLVKSRVLRERREGRYEMRARQGLYLQQSKCILQYFDVKHSIAGLEKFQKKLEENASDFLLMAVDEVDNSLEDVAYELMYEGSVNKFRSVKGMAENRYELAKHLARQSILQLVADDFPDTNLSSQLRKFFKGKNAIEFADLWERVFTFFGIAKKKRDADFFRRHLEGEISRVQTAEASVTSQLKSDLLEHLRISIAMADALCEPDFGFQELGVEAVAESMRNSNLIRHHFVRIPLLNYTKYAGALCAGKVDGPVEMDEGKLDLSPRYVNLDECMMFVSVSGKRGEAAFNLARKYYELANRSEIRGVSWTNVSLEVEEDE